MVHGIDPGFSGAIATVIRKGDELSVVDVQDMPTKLFYYGKDKKGRRGYDLDRLMLYLKASSVVSIPYSLNRTSLWTQTVGTPRHRPRLVLEPYSECHMH